MNFIDRLKLSKIWALQTDRQTDRRTDRCDWKHHHAAIARETEIAL